MFLQDLFSKLKHFDRTEKVQFKEVLDENDNKQRRPNIYYKYLQRIKESERNVKQLTYRQRMRGVMYAINRLLQLLIKVSVLFVRICWFAWISLFSQEFKGMYFKNLHKFCIGQSNHEFKARAVSSLLLYVWIRKDEIKQSDIKHVFSVNEEIIKSWMLKFIGPTIRNIVNDSTINYNFISVNTVGNPEVARIKRYVISLLRCF